MANVSPTPSVVGLGLGTGLSRTCATWLNEKLVSELLALNLPGAVAGLFGVSPTAGPAVAINAAHPASRQRWTLSHEYAHFLLHKTRPEITRISGYQRVPEFERFADSFAAAFLMPRSGLERRLRHFTGTSREIVVADLLVLASEFGVSAQAMFLRLEDLAFIPAGEWDRLEATGIDVVAANRLHAGKPRQRDTARFPRRYVLLALDAYRRDLLTERELAEYLDIDRLELRQFLGRLSRTSVESVESIREIQLPLSDMVEVNAR